MALPRPNDTCCRAGLDIMLIVTKQQMQTLAAPYAAAFHQRIRTFLHDRAPELATAAGPELDNQIAASCHDAESLGCVSEQEIVLFVILSLLHGPGFATREDWAIQAVATHKAAGRASGVAQALMAASATRGRTGR